MPELRRDPLLKRWVVFSPERKQRPHDVRPPTLPPSTLDSFAAGNEHLTPGEVYALRPSGTPADGPGWQVRVVPNRFPALRIEGDLNPEGAGIYDRMNGIGAHEVVIENPDAELALEEQPVEGVANVLKAFRSRVMDLSHDTRFRSIAIFKNVGALAGATLRHPHSQIIALPVLPQALEERLASARAHYREKQRNLFADILQAEEKAGERMVYENAGFAAFCPYASRFPFEVLLLPKQPNPHFHQSDDHALTLAADVLKNVLQRLAKGLRLPDYNLIVHSAPLREENEGGPVDRYFRWHIEILPRLAGIAGFELGTGYFINSTLPEEAARFLRSVRIKP